MKSKASQPSKQRARIKNPAVAKAFELQPPVVRERLLSLRQLILDTAAELPEVGALEETLKWNEPAYVTASKMGSTIRISGKRGSDGKYAMYFNCHTTLVDTFRTLFPTTFRYFGNREIEFDVGQRVPTKELKICIAMALTYHKRGKT